MNTHADKTQENKSKTMANVVSQKETVGESTFQFVNNRPEVTTQRKLQETVNNNPQVKHVAQLQAIANHYSTQKPYPIQKKENKTGLPDTLKSGIENLSGYSMDDVKVHYNSNKPAHLQAHAYAQGTDIHLASGQERHLAHEAWHVVQQKQGRVRPTKQLKATVSINDDAGLEKEADIMGARAMNHASPSDENAQLKSSESSINERAIQAYSIEREPKLGTLYSVSDDKEMITGMHTPNHELYVAKNSMLAQIKEATKASMLDFSFAGTQPMFGKNYNKIGAHFKVLEFTTPPEVEKPSLLERMRGKGKSKSHSVNLNQQYEEKVLPGMKQQAKDKYKAAMDKISQSPWKNEFGNIKVVLHNLVTHLELFKKLVIANQTAEHYHDVVNDMDYPQQLIASIEGLAYSKALTKADFAKIQHTIDFNASKMKYSFGKDENVMDATSEIVELTNRLGEIMPDKIPVDMLLVHSANYQEAMWKSMEERTPMFYRACDVMAATVMGNTVNPQNEEQLKIYAAGGNLGAFHYAAKILKSGKDWVSLESFAASDRESEILGLNAQNAGKNLDNSWQYIMYGSIRKRGKTGGEEDNAFELYTKLRYYLKGIKEPGKFRTDQRNRLHSTIAQNAFVGIGGMDLETSTAIWERLKSSGVFNAAGEVENPDYLEEDYIKLRLPIAQQARAEAISTRLDEIYRTPRSHQRQIQAVDSNELRNIAGWLQHAGLPADQALGFSIKYGAQLAAHPETPQKVYNDALKEMMLALK